MEILENVITKAKETFEVVSKKTGEVVSTQKNKFDIASIEAKRAKDFQRLGEIYFNSVKDTQPESSEIKELVEAIVQKNAKIKEIEEEINLNSNKKICANCSQANDKSSAFCSKCGSKLD